MMSIRFPGACLRITNTYGPRHQMAHDEYGVVNWFIRKAIDDEMIPVFGDGRILRDFLFVDDVVDCFIQVADCPQAYGEVFNVGTGVPYSFIDLAKKIVRDCRDREGGLDGVHEGAKRSGARRLLHGYLQNQEDRGLETQDRPGRGPPKERSNSTGSTRENIGNDSSE